MALGNKARLCDQVKFDHVVDVDGTYDGTGTMVDMRDYDGCCVVVTGGTTADTTHHLTSVNVISNTTAAGAGTDHIIAEAVTTDGGTTDDLTQADYGISANTTKNDQMIVLDVRADQMYAGDRFICCSTVGTGTFITNILYIRYNGNFSFKDMFQATRTAFQYDGDLT